MSAERKRFRARYPVGALPGGVEVGRRHVFAPDVLFEEWSMGVMQRPDRLDATTPRPGDVIRVIDPRPQDGRPWWEVWAEDPPSHVTTVEVLLTVMGDVVLATPGRVKALLEHLCSHEIRNDAEGAEVAVACLPWLAERFPGIARAAKHVPTYAVPENYGLWVDGVAAALGHWPDRRVVVPVPPFTFTRASRLDAIGMSANLHVRPDVVNRLYGGHRAN